MKLTGMNLLAMFKCLKNRVLIKLSLCNYPLTIISMIFKLFSLETLCKQGFSYLSQSGSRGCLIWEKQPTNIQNWEKWTGETKQSNLL